MLYTPLKVSKLDLQMLAKPKSVLLDNPAMWRGSLR